MPPPALTREHVYSFRNLGPAYGVRDEPYSIGFLLLPFETVEPDDHFHVFGHIADHESAHLDDRLLLKKREGAGEDKQRIQSIPPYPAEQKSADILNDLKQDQSIAREIDCSNGDFIFHFYTVQDADN